VLRPDRQAFAAKGRYAPIERADIAYARARITRLLRASRLPVPDELWLDLHHRAGGLVVWLRARRRLPSPQIEVLSESAEKRRKPRARDFNDGLEAVGWDLVKR
jgi:hypothetical protein